MKQSLACIAASLFLGLALSARATITGQWDFNSSNLVATVGTDLAYRGDTAATTTFTTATIGGSPAVVMNFPACSQSQGYTVTHGIAPNPPPDTIYVNQYTVIMDIMYPAASAGTSRALWQLNPANSDNATIFVGNRNGLGGDDGHYGEILPDTWHRVAFVVDQALMNYDQAKVYIDGKRVLQLGVDFPPLDLILSGVTTFTMDTNALLFTDNNGQTAAGFVNSIQIHDRSLTDTEIFALGKPTADGIPTSIPPVTSLAAWISPTNATTTAGMNANCFVAYAVGPGTFTYQWYHGNTLLVGQTNVLLSLTNAQVADAGSYTVVVNNGTNSTNSPPAGLTVKPQGAYVTGQWDFNQGNLAASCGQPLQYFNPTVQSDTSFGTTTSFGISAIAGQSANVMYCVPSAANWGGFIMTHGIAPNGGGAKVNQYTLILDLLYPSASHSAWRSLWQTDISNTSDGEVFFNPQNGLGISGEYPGLKVTPNVWHRVVLSFDLTKNELGKYIDGTNVYTGLIPDLNPLPPSQHIVQELGQGVDARWSAGPTALLLGDENGEVKPVYLSSVQIRNGRMDDASVTALGKPTANKIPGCIKAGLAGGNVVIDWTGNVLEYASSPAGPWNEIVGAAHPHTVLSPTGIRFFRVRQ